MMTDATPDLVEVPCPICGSNRFRVLFHTKDYRFGVSQDRFGMRKCRDCGGGYLSPRPSESVMSQYYPDKYYWSWEGRNVLSWEELIARRGPQLAEKARWLADMRPGRLLDVGAQKGDFLWYMQQMGWEVEGVELDNDVPNPAGMPIKYGDLLEMPFAPNSFDAVTLWAVLEHVYHPARIIERAAAILRPGGRLVVLVTNLHSIQARWYRADDYPRHLTIFTKRSIRGLLCRHGLKLLRAYTGQEIFGGALNGGLVYLVKRLGGYSEDEAYFEWKQLRDPLLFYTKWRGKPSRFVRTVSRMDRALTLLPETILDRLGFGFILTVAAEKVGRTEE